MKNKIITDWQDINLVVDIPFVARLLAQNPETIKRRCQRGEIKAFKAGREWRITKDALREYTESKRII